MKKINSFAALCSLTAIFAIAPSCQKEIALENVDDQVPAGYEKVTLTAGIDTKINGGFNDDGSGWIKWNSSSENISVFYTIGNEFKLAKFSRINCSGTAASGTFQGEVESGDDRLFKYVVFPYSDSQDIATSGQIKVNMSKSQGPTNEDGLTSGSILAGKVNGTEVSLATTCAYLRINIPITGMKGTRRTTDIKTIVIKGRRTTDENAETSEFMSGTSFITFDADGKPSLSPRIAKNYNYDSIELHPKSAVVDAVTVYCGGEILCPIFPGTYDHLSFELKNCSDESVGFFEVNATNVFTRGLAKNLGTIYFPYIKTGTIGKVTYGTRTLSADSDGSTLTLTGSADAFVGHPATLSDYEFGFEAWAGDSQLADIVATSAAPTEGKKGESVDFSFTSNDAAYASVTKVKAYAKVGTDGDKVYGEEMNVTKPKEVRTVTFDFTADEIYTPGKLSDAEFAYITPTTVGVYKELNSKGADIFPDLTHKFLANSNSKVSRMRKWDGTEWQTDGDLTTSTPIPNLLGCTLTKTEGGVTYTIKFPDGQYTQYTASAGGTSSNVLMTASNYSIELPAFAGFKLTKVVCSTPSTASYKAAVVNEASDTPSKTKEVVHPTGSWEDIAEFELPIAEAEAGQVQYLKFTTQPRIPYFILEYTEQ